MKKLFVFLLMMFLFVINVDAASLCSYQEQVELNQKSKNVKVSYEVVEGDLVLDDGSTIKQDMFDIKILNVTDEFYVTVKNDQNGDERRFTSSDAKDGIITFRWKGVSKIVNFTFNVYTTDKTTCPDEMYNTVYLRTKRYNPFHNMAICNELDDFFLCEKYVDVEDVDQAVFYSQLEKYRNGKIDNKGEEIDNTNFFDRVFDFFKQNGLYILGGLVLIAGVSFIVYRITHKKQRELGL